MAFHPQNQREVAANFDGGRITSDGGALLLREVEARAGFVAKFAECFTDCRDPPKTDHTGGELVAQRAFGLALGYENLNDHDFLRADSPLAVAVGKSDPEGRGLSAHRRTARNRP